MLDPKLGRLYLLERGEHFLFMSSRGLNRPEVKLPFQED